MVVAFRGREESVNFLLSARSNRSSFQVTDMLVAVLNTCTAEELEEQIAEEDYPEAIVSPTESAVSEEGDRKKVIKNKIMAVGRMARVFALLRSAPLPSILIFVLKSTSGRSPRKSQNSSPSLALRSFLTVLLVLVSKASRRPLPALVMRGRATSKTRDCHPICTMRSLKRGRLSFPIPSPKRLLAKIVLPSVPPACRKASRKGSMLGICRPHHSTPLLVVLRLLRLPALLGARRVGVATGGTRAWARL